MDLLNNAYCLYREYFMYPIDETTVANDALLSEYKMLQVRMYILNVIK